jgi:asparagine synthase (glutamine-hydrolysing)
MCGIAGIWNRNGRPADASALHAMLDALAHRGPDDRGSWIDGAEALGHVRLSIIDPSTEAHQPFETPDGTGVLAYNGEVYNFGELRRELQAEGVDFRSASDSEVVLKALHSWGPARAVPRLNGMFAFAYFDRRSRELWLARDRLGIKPIYLHRTRGRVLFASEIKGILAHPSVERRADIQTLMSLFLRYRTLDSRTPFEGIEALEPGTMWRITPDTEEVTTWYHVLEDLDVERLVAASNRDPRQWPAEFERRLRASVALHLVSDAPLAATCSGGVDSGLVAAFGREAKPDLVAYVADQEGGVSEGEAAAKVARHLGIELRRVSLDRRSFLRHWPLATRSGEIPCLGPEEVARFLVAQTARSDGFKVLLTGEGSDEMFGGYDSHAKTHRMWQNWSRRRWLSRRERRRWPKRLGKLENAPTSLSQAREDFVLGRRLTLGADPTSRLRTTAIFKRLESVRPLSDRAFLTHGLTDLHGHLAGILHGHDRMGMAASVEMRVPFIENELLDFAIHLPRRAKFHRGVSKWLVKQAALRYLPRESVMQPKKGFPTPSEFFLGTTPFLENGYVAERFQWPRRHQAEILRLIDREPAERFQLMSVELWGRVFFRGECPEALGEQLLKLAPAVR